MSHRGWIHLTRAASAVGLGVFAVVTLAAPQDSSLSAFFNVWVYNGLMVLACVIAGSHAYLVAARARRVDRDHSGSRLLDVRRALVRDLQAGDVSVDGRCRVHRLLLRCCMSGSCSCSRSRARSIAGTALAGRNHGRARGRSPRSCSARRARSREHGGLALDRGHEPRVPARRRPPALRGLRGLLRYRAGGPGQRWLLLGLGTLATTAADAVYLFQSAEGTYVEGTWVDVLWPAAMLLIASSAWAPDRSREGLEVEGRPLLAVPAVCALVATGILVYDHFRTVNLLAILLATARPAPRDRATRADVPREPADCSS